MYEVYSFQMFCIYGILGLFTIFVNVQYTSNIHPARQCTWLNVSFAVLQMNLSNIYQHFYHLLKEEFTQKLKFCHYLLILMLLQTYTNFVEDEDDSLINFVHRLKVHAINILMLQ